MLRKVKSLVLLVISLIKRCFCCIRRRRDSSTDLPISAGGGKLYSQRTNQEPGWDDWDAPTSVVSDGVNSAPMNQMSAVELQIHQYRQKKLMESQQVPEEEPQREPDLFEGLAPTLPKKPQVIIYARPEDDSLVSNRQTSISCTDALMQVGGELGEWDEEGGETQWGVSAEEVDPSEVDLILHQQKQQQRYQQKLAREARKKQVQQSRESKLNKLATKIS